MNINRWVGMLIIGLSVCWTTRLQAQDAESILDKTASILKDTKGVTVEFAIQTRSERQQLSESFEGTIDIKGEKFVLKTPDMVTWFDGATQWSYAGQTEEVNVSAPTGDELQAINPVILLQSYQKGFKARYEGECTATNGKAAYEIRLLPKKKSDITEVELQIEKYSSYPVSLTVRMQDGISSTIHINKLQTGVNRPDDFFVFPEADYPDVEVIDLR